MSLASVQPGAIAASATSAGTRQAALLLHGIGSADREWLLGELAAGQRALLEALLGELQALGVPPSPELIDEMLVAGVASTRPAAVPVAGASSIESLVQELAQTPSPTIAELLRDEPDALVARVLRSTGGAWSRGLLKQLGVSRRRRIEDLLRASGPATDAAPGRRLDSAILRGLVARAGRPAFTSRGDSGRFTAARIAASLRRLARRASGSDLSSKSPP